MSSVAAVTHRVPPTWLCDVTSSSPVSHCSHLITFFYFCCYSTWGCFFSSYIHSLFLKYFFLVSCVLIWWSLHFVFSLSLTSSNFPLSSASLACFCFFFPLIAVFSHLVGEDGSFFEAFWSSLSTVFLLFNSLCASSLPRVYACMSTHLSDGLWVLYVSHRINRHSQPTIWLRLSHTHLTVCVSLWGL